MNNISREVQGRAKAIVSTILLFVYGAVVWQLAIWAGSWWILAAGAVLLILVYLFWPWIRGFRYGLKHRPRRAA